MIILTAISIIIFLYFINFFGCFLNPDLYSKYDRLLNRAPFFSYPQSVKKLITVMEKDAPTKSLSDHPYSQKERERSVSLLKQCLSRSKT